MKSTSPSEDSEERAAGAVLFREEDGRRLYLLLRHQQGGHWGFPKGRIEAGETVHDAAMREIHEETGIQRVELIDGVTVTSRYPIRREGRGILKTVVYFAARVVAASVALSGEHTDARWVTFADGMQILTHAESRRVLSIVEGAQTRASGDGPRGSEWPTGR